MSNQRIIEIWKPLKYMGIDFINYEISSLGRVRSLTRKIPMHGGFFYTKHGQLMSLRTHKNNPYLFVDLRYTDERSGKSIQKTVYVGRALYESFVGEVPDGYKVTYKDGNHKRNTLSNLELKTQSEINRQNMGKYPHLRWQLRNRNLETGYYKTLAGRKVSPFAKRVVELLLAANLPPKVIADKAGVSLSYVYNQKKYKNGRNKRDN